MTRADRRAESELDKVIIEVEGLIMQGRSLAPDEGHDWDKFARALRAYVQAEVKHTIAEMAS